MKSYILKLEGEKDDIYETIIAKNEDDAEKKAENICEKYKDTSYSYDWLIEQGFVKNED